MDRGHAPGGGIRTRAPAKPIAACCIAAAALAFGAAHAAAARTLDIYFIDVEGGQSTLIATPAGQSLLIDAGFPDGGTAQSKPGEPHAARDANRIAAAARDAGVTRIDTLLITHFHADHFGGVVELAQLMPIRTFVDHGGLAAAAKAYDPETLDAFNAYARVRENARHVEAKPGDRLRLKGVDAVVVSSAGATIRKPLAGAGGRNTVCAASARDAKDPTENPRSTGILLQFGRFRFLDVGDLTGPPLFALACPDDRIGPVDVYLLPHHGGADASDPAIFAAFKARVAILNNGAKKGGEPEMFSRLRQVQGLQDVWQLHRSEAAGGENFPDDRIANLDEASAHWIKVSAKADGSFRVMNGRTGVAKDYAAR